MESQVRAFRHLGITTGNIMIELDIKFLKGLIIAAAIVGIILIVAIITSIQ